MIQSPDGYAPLAAMEGTTLRLKTATTKRAQDLGVRGRGSGEVRRDWVVVDKVQTKAGSSPGVARFGMTNFSSLPTFRFHSRDSEGGCPTMSIT